MMYASNIKLPLSIWLHIHRRRRNMKSSGIFGDVMLSVFGNYVCAHAFPMGSVSTYCGIGLKAGMYAGSGMSAVRRRRIVVALGESCFSGCHSSLNGRISGKEFFRKHGQSKNKALSHRSVDHLRFIGDVDIFKTPVRQRQSEKPHSLKRMRLFFQAEEALYQCFLMNSSRRSRPSLSTSREVQ